MARPKGTKNKKSEYIIELEANGEKIRKEGDDLMDILDSFDLKFYKTKGVLRVIRGNKKYEKFLYIPEMVRMFNEFPSMSRKIIRSRFTKYAEIHLK